MLNEIHPAVEANNVRARRAADAVQDKALLTTRQRKATVRLLLRELVLLVIMALTWTAFRADLIVWQIAFFLTTLLMFCIGTWFGVWWQFMTRKEV